MSPKDLHAKLQEFGTLPDDAIVHDAVAAKILNIGLRTLRRTQPVPRIQLSPNRIGRRVGDLRALVRGGAVAA